MGGKHVRSGRLGVVGLLAAALIASLVRSRPAASPAPAPRSAGEDVQETPGRVDPTLASSFAGFLRTVKEHVWAISAAGSAVALLLGARSLRYYDSAFRELGVAGLPVEVDQAQLLARAVVQALILTSLVLAAAAVYTSSRECFKGWEWLSRCASRRGSGAAGCVS